MLEKHFDSDFTSDQEKEITFKRWPPGYQSWKLGLALNGLKRIDAYWWVTGSFYQLNLNANKYDLKQKGKEKVT